MATEHHSLRPAAMNHADLRERIGALCGEDEQAFKDTLEGASMFPEQLASLMREAALRVNYADACNALIKTIEMRRDRHLHFANKARELALTAMQEAGERQIVQPDMTITVKKGAASVKIVNELELPEGYMVKKTTFTPDKKAIGEALKSGLPVPGATLSNSPPTLDVRMK